MSEIVLQVSEPDAVELEYVEAKIKPEVTGHATPTEEAQTVTPAPGTTFSAVEVDAIPPEYVVPSGTLDVTENADDINVRDKAAVNVNVQPNLQTPDPITPTKAQQTITPSAGHDGLTSAVVEPIPDEYIVPSGTLNITENADGINVTDKATVNVAVPVPVMPEEYATGGSFSDLSLTGYYIKRGTKTISNSRFSSCKELVAVDMPDTIELIDANAFSTCLKLQLAHLPSALAEIKQYAFWSCQALTSITFHSKPTIGQSIFWACSNLQNIYVPWSEGEVTGAPWGATNATIHYDYTGG